MSEHKTKCIGKHGTDNQEKLGSIIEFLIFCEMFISQSDPNFGAGYPRGGDRTFSPASEKKVNINSLGFYL